ncbi:MAG: MerR family transcriptional regulator [Anaerovoracaceae bacterium]
MKYLTIKEFAKIHNVNTRTLHYYDSVGLFSPKYKGENGYRYYSYMQGSEFEMILAFRELSMSVEEIKTYTERRNAEHLETMLSKKSSEIDHKMKQLKQIKNVLDSKKLSLNLIKSMDLNAIDVVSCKTEYLFLTTINNEKEVDQEAFEEVMNLSRNEGINRIFNASYGSMMPVTSLEQGLFEDYSHYFIKIQPNKMKNRLFEKESGQYLRAYCVGEWSKLPQTYERILKYANKHNLKLSGYSYEQGLNEMAINKMSEYVTEIMIKCEKI